MNKPEFGQTLAFSLMGDDELESLPVDMRMQLTITGDQMTILERLLQSILTNIKFRAFSGQGWQIALQGAGSIAKGNPLSSCISVNAYEPIAIRRKEWGIDRWAEYRNNGSILEFKSYAKRPDGDAFLGPQLNAGDFMATDWEIINNPNIEEIDITDEDDDGFAPVDGSVQIVPVEPPSVHTLEGIYLTRDQNSSIVVTNDNLLIDDNNNMFVRIDDEAIPLTEEMKKEYDHPAS